VSEASSKTEQGFDEEVLERLPFWVRELLAILDEVKKEKKQG
jgi:hypothetical protein